MIFGIYIDLASNIDRCRVYKPACMIAGLKIKLLVLCNVCYGRLVTIFPIRANDNPQSIVSLSFSQKIKKNKYEKNSPRIRPNKFKMRNISWNLESDVQSNAK